MKRKLVVILMTVSVLALTACGGSESKTEQPVEETVELKEEVVLEETEEEVAVEEEEKVETVYLVASRKWGYVSDGVREENFTENTYDEKGNEILSVNKNADGSIRSTYSREYDENGNLLKLTMEYEDSVSYIEHEYGENGNLSKIVESNENGEITSTELYEYDANNMLMKTSKFNAENVLEQVCEYDENGTMRKMIFYMDGVVSTWYEYNEKGDEILCKWEMEDFVTEEICINEYDENDKLVKVIKNYTDLSGDTTEYILTYEYDEYGNVLNVYQDGQILEQYKYEYDENGNCINEIWKNASGDLESFTEREYISMEVPAKNN